MFRTVLSIVTIAVLFAAQPYAAAGQSKSSGRPAAKPAVTGTININTASAAELQTLPGIGAKTAERIVEYRQKNGLFKKVEEILEISRSCPDSLNVFDFGVFRTVSGSRQKSQ